MPPSMCLIFSPFPFLLYSWYISHIRGGKFHFTSASKAILYRWPIDQFCYGRIALLTDKVAGSSDTSPTYTYTFNIARCMYVYTHENTSLSVAHSVVLLSFLSCSCASQMERKIELASRTKCSLIVSVI